MQKKKLTGISWIRFKISQLLPIFLPAMRQVARRNDIYYLLAAALAKVVGEIGSKSNLHRSLHLCRRFCKRWCPLKMAQFGKKTSYFSKITTKNLTNVEAKLCSVYCSSTAAKKLVFVYFFKKLHNEESNLEPIQKNLNFLVLFDWKSTRKKMYYV